MQVHEVTVVWLLAISKLSGWGLLRQLRLVRLFWFSTTTISLMHTKYSFTFVHIVVLFLVVDDESAILLYIITWVSDVCSGLCNGPLKDSFFLGGGSCLAMFDLTLVCYCFGCSVSRSHIRIAMSDAWVHPLASELNLWPIRKRKCGGRCMHVAAMADSFDK